jgi:ABC-type multidrug transport system ATPase subunit
MLPNGDMTEVGERGISLSGGQKQRISIARCLYARTEVTCLDDPFSALDAHVGKAVFTDVIQGEMKGTTRVLVTHALHFLPYCDYIYSMDNGYIVERGTYAELMAKNGQFSKFVNEFGGKEEDEDGDEDDEDGVKGNKDGGGKSGSKIHPSFDKEKKKPGIPAALMQVEERNTGAVSNKVYKDYMKAAHGKFLVPILLLALAFMQASNVMNSYWWVFSAFCFVDGLVLMLILGGAIRLVFWQEK